MTMAKHERAIPGEGRTKHNKFYIVTPHLISPHLISFSSHFISFSFILSQIVSGISAREAKSSMYFKQDFTATVVYILGTSVEADAITILDITDALTKSMKRQLLLTNSVRILYLLPVQDVSRSAALQALTTASEDGSFASYFNVQLSSHGVPNRVSVTAPLQTDRNPTEAPTESPVRETLPMSHLSKSTVGLIAGTVSMGFLFLLISAYLAWMYSVRQHKRK